MWCYKTWPLRSQSILHRTQIDSCGTMWSSCDHRKSEFRYVSLSNGLPGGIIVHLIVLSFNTTWNTLMSFFDIYLQVMISHFPSLGFIKIKVCFKYIKRHLEVNYILRCKHLLKMMTSKRIFLKHVYILCMLDGRYGAQMIRPYFSQHITEQVQQEYAGYDRYISMILLYLLHFYYNISLLEKFYFQSAFPLDLNSDP